MDIHAYEWETWILQILGETAYCYVFLGGNSSLMWHYWALLNPLLLYEEQSDLIDKLGKIKLSMFSSWLSWEGIYCYRIPSLPPAEAVLLCGNNSGKCYWLIMIAYFWTLLAGMFGFLMKLSKIFSPLHLPLSYLSICSDVRWIKLLLNWSFQSLWQEK